MNSITDPLRQLVRRKLWPVALLLVGALVAVPLTLAKQPQATAVTTPPANAAAKADGIPATFVSAAEPTETDGESGTVKRRRTLGAKKDPFEPAPLPKKKKTAKKKTSTADAKAAADAAAAKSDSTSSTGGTSATTAPTAPVTPTATPTPKKTYPLFSIQVRFGSTEGDQLASRTLARMTALPSAEAPAFVYTGVDEDGKTAVFMLTGAVTAEGDGKCLPTPENCQTLKLRAGETEFLTVAASGEDTKDDTSDDTPEAQYELDLLKVHAKATTVASKATASQAPSSK